MNPSPTGANPGAAFFCSSPSWGGLELNVLRLAGWLGERGRPVTILAPSDTPLYREAAGSGIPTVPFRRPRKYFDLTTAGVLAGTLRRLGLKTMFIFHRDDMDAAAWARFFGGRRVRPVYQQQMRLGVSRRDPVHALRYRAYRAWIAPLEYLRDEVIAMTTVPARKIHVIPLGIDDGYYREPEPTRSEARSYFGLRDGVTVFGIMGRIEPGKGQAFLLQALKSLREEYGEDSGVELLVVGDVTIEPGLKRPRRDHAADLRTLAGSLGLGGAVHFHPFVKDNRLFYRAVDACVMATAHETYGMVTLEAMASGVPVIGTDSTGTREILEGGTLGMLYTPDDEASFLRRAREVIAGNYPPSMLRAAVAAVRERYSHDRECRMIIDLMDALELRDRSPAAG